MVTQPTVARRLPWIACLATVVLSGCTAVQGIREHLAYNDTVDDFVLTWRNSAWASQAWHERKWQFAGHPYLHDFGEGFRAGYRDVASGGNGCTPALPPRKYWNWRYQTAEGQAKVAAWFEGYPHGARAAEEDGAGLHRQIQTSELLRAEYRLGHEPPYKSPLFFHNPDNWCPPGETMVPDEVQPVDPSSPLPIPAQPSDNKANRAAPDSPSSGPVGTGTKVSQGMNPGGAKRAPSQSLPSVQQETLLTETGDPYTVLPWARMASTAPGVTAAQASEQAH